MTIRLWDVHENFQSLRERRLSAEVVGEFSAINAIACVRRQLRRVLGIRSAVFALDSIVDRAPHRGARWSGAQSLGAPRMRVHVLDTKHQTYYCPYGRTGGHDAGTLTSERGGGMLLISERATQVTCAAIATKQMSAVSCEAMNSSLVALRGVSARSRTH